MEKDQLGRVRRKVNLKFCIKYGGLVEQFETTDSKGELRAPDNSLY